MVFVRNSRCHLWVEFYVDHAETPLKRVIGELYMNSRQKIRIPVSISGHRLQVVAYLGVAEGKPCSLRSWKIGYHVMGGCREYLARVVVIEKMLQRALACY